MSDTKPEVDVESLTEAIEQLQDPLPGWIVVDSSSRHNPSLAPKGS